MGGVTSVVAPAASKIVKLFMAVAVATAATTGVLYAKQHSIEQKLSKNSSAADGAITTTKLSPELQNQIESAIKLAGAFPVTDKDGNPTSCSSGQVVSFSNGQMVCVTLSIGADGQVSVATAGIPGANGASPDGLNGANGGSGSDGSNGSDGAGGANGNGGTNGVDGTAGSTGAAGTTGSTGALGATGTTGARGATGATGATGAAGSAGVLSTLFGNGLSGSLAGQVLSMNIVTDVDGGLSNGTNGLSLLATCSSNQLLKFNGTAWACGNDNIGAAATADLTSVTPGVTVTGGTGAVLGSGTSIAIATAAAGQDGLLSGTNWTTFNNKENALTFTGNGMFARSGNTVSSTTCTNTQILKYTAGSWACAADADTTYTADGTVVKTGSSFGLPSLGTASTYGSATTIPVFTTDAQGRITNVVATSIPTATAGNNGLLTAADWAAFNSKQNGLTFGNLTSSNTAGGVVTITGGTGAVVGGNANVSIATASASQTGLLNSVDWNTFNGKEGGLTFTGNGMFSRSGNTISSNTTCASGQLLAYNGSSWVCSNQTTATTYTAGTNGGLAVTGTVLTFDPNNLAAVSSIAGTDKVVVYSGSAPKTITYDDLFGGVLGSLNYRGTWNATTDTPTLTAACATGTKGYYYVVGTAGSTDLDGNTTWNLNDWVVCNGTVWQRVQTSSGVASVFGRMGSVTAQNGDYTAGQVTNTAAGGIAAATVQAAINELDTEKLGSALTSGLVFVGNGSNTAAGVALSGDVSLSSSGVVTIGNGAVTSAKIADGTIAFADFASNSCTNGQTIKYNGSAWTCGSDTDTTYTAANTGANQNAPLTVSGSTIGFSSGTTAGQYWAWDGSKWALVAPSVNVTTVGALDAQSATANGATISGDTIYLQSADATHAGLVNTASQTFSGAKTFANGLSVGANQTLTALAGTGAFDFSAAGGTFKTSTGANTLNGDTTIAANKNLAAASGTGNLDFSASSGTFKTTTGLTTVGGNLTVIGSTLLSSSTITDKASGGAIGTAAATVDTVTSFLVNQTTAGQTLSLPTPTTVTAGRTVVVSNVGSAAFTLGGVSITPGNSAILLWNGSAWSIAGGGASSCDATKSYACNGGNTLAAALTLGTTDANVLNLATAGSNRFQIANNASTLTGQGTTVLTTTANGYLTLSTNGTGAVSLDSGGTGSVSIATGAADKAITVGSSTGVNSLSILTGTGGATTTSTAATGTANSFVANAITSGTAMNIQANGITGGKALAVTSTATAMTGSLAGVYLTGNNAANTGSLLTLQSSGALSKATGVNVDTSASAGLAAQFAGAVAMKKGSDFTTTGVTVDAAFGNTSLVRLTGASTQTIDSIAGGTDGKILTIVNAAGQAAVIRDASTATTVTAANQVKTGTGGDLTLAVDASTQLIYDAGSSVWRVVGGSGGTTGTVASCANTAACTTALGGVWNKTLLVDTSAGGVTVNLPTAVANSGKSITVKKTTSDANVVTIDGATTETIDGQLTQTLTSYQSSIQMVSNGTNVYTTSDVGAVGAEYGEAAPSTGTVTPSNNGSSAAPTSYIPFTLPSAGVWEVNTVVRSNTAKVGQAGTSGDSGVGTAIYTSVGNTLVANSEARSAYMGQVGTGPVSSSFGIQATANGVSRISTTGAATYYVGVWNDGNTTATTVSDANGRSKVAWKKISGYVPIVGQSVEYTHATKATDQSITSGTATDITWTSAGTAGNIPFNGTTLFTLSAGKTYSLESQLGTTASAAATFIWTDSSNNDLSTLGAVRSYGSTRPNNGTSAAAADIPATATFTPASNVQVKVRVLDTNGGSPTIAGTQSITNGNATSYAKITQLGSTASTGIAMSSLAGAIATGALDNAGYTQTWNWNTLGANNGLVLNSTDATGSGNLFNITSASTAGPANGLARFNFSGIHTGNGLQVDDATATGTAVNISANGLTSGKGLAIGSTATATTGNVLSVTSASTAGFTAGGIRFNLTGAHTGNGVQIDDATLTGNAVAIAANALTTGSGLSITSSYAAGNSTNGLLYVANTSAVTNGVIFRAQANSTANSGLTLGANGNLGVGIAPAADSLITMKAGSATVAPLKFTAGTNLTTPTNGTMEYDGSSLYFTSPLGGSTRRFMIGQTLTGTITAWAPGSIAGNNCAQNTVTVAGAATGDAVVAAPPTGFNASSAFVTVTAYAQGTTVYVRLCNNRFSTAETPVTGDYKVYVTKYN